MSICTSPKNSIDALKNYAKQLRVRIIETSHKARIPHLGSCLSCIDILTALYFRILTINPADPTHKDRDRCILSKGHGAPALFQVLAMRGFFDETLLENYGQNGSLFSEHPPAPNYLPGIEAATGSLGHGLPIGAGMALSAKITNSPYKTYVVLGDGECNEGSTWESALFSSAQKLSNLCVIVDFNKWQATGRSCEIMPLERLCEMWKSFGWNVYEVDGHNFDQMISLLSQIDTKLEQPTAIIAHTVKGKGVPFMEDNNNWHYCIPNPDELAASKQALNREIKE